VPLGSETCSGLGLVLSHSVNILGVGRDFGAGIQAVPSGLIPVWRHPPEGAFNRGWEAHFPLLSMSVCAQKSGLPQADASLCSYVFGA
jgi:hypothetical protein